MHRRQLQIKKNCQSHFNILQTHQPSTSLMSMALLLLQLQLNCYSWFIDYTCCVKCEITLQKYFSYFHHHGIHVIDQCIIAVLSIDVWCCYLYHIILIILLIFNEITLSINEIKKPDKKYHNKVCPNRMICCDKSSQSTAIETCTNSLIQTISFH